ncbi:hypothetical protein A7982_12115 [Minicystis rosea]|nr:hypothetical protein A7982_12115 [Minicystis rosea]
MTTYRFSGHIISQSDHKGLPDLRVEAWDAEGQCTDLVAFAVTDARGAFTMALDDTYLADLFQDRSPTVTFRVFVMGDDPTPLSTRYFLWKLVAENTTGRIEVGSAVTAGGLVPSDQREPAPSVVRGRVLSATGEPLEGTKVKVFDRRLSSDEPETELAEDTRTTGGGQYRIPYTPPSSAGRVAPDLIVRAYDHDDNVIAESERICHAPATATVDLIVGGALRGPSEIDALQSRIASHTTGFDIQTASSEELDHLACASGSVRSHVDAFVAAGSLSAVTGAPVAAHYALIREGLPATRRELLRVPPQDLRRALQNAASRNTVPKSVNDNIVFILGQLRTAAVEMAFEAPSGATGSVGGLVTTVLGEESARTFLDQYLSHEGPMEDFWEALPSGEYMPGTTPEQIANLQLAFQLGALTRFHFPLIKELQAQKATGSFTSTRDLAKWDEDQWVQVLERVRDAQVIGFPANTPGMNEAGAPDADVKKRNYAVVLRRTLAAAHPTAAIAGDIERATTSGTPDPVVQFIDENASFELNKTRVAHYLAQNEISLDTDTVSRLRQIEVLHKLTPRYSEMRVLIDAGLHSAREVVRMGRNAFIANHAEALGGVVVAEEIFANARDTATQALAFQSKLGSSMNRRGSYAVADQATPRAGMTQAPEAADWATLFGSPDFCDCTHCNSVYGPAAYFVDLLEFLGQHDSNVPQGSSHPTAKEVLLQKRPDLAHIDLSCDNTLVPLPYVDLVNEILEHAVGTPSAAYPAHIATTGKAEELRALPDVNKAAGSAYANAYGTLAEATYPWALPFDLGATEARVYLNHLGVPRHELMKTLQYSVETAPSTYDVVPPTQDIVAERLGLSRSERLAITTSVLEDPVPLPGLWGFRRARDRSTMRSRSSRAYQCSSSTRG